MATIVQLLQEAFAAADAQRNDVRDEGAREFALACTHIEDAIMRVNRGFALRQGVFTIGDVEAQI